MSRRLASQNEVLLHELLRNSLHAPQVRFISKTKKTRNACLILFWRRHPDLNRGITVLQTVALPLGYSAEIFGADYGARTRHLDLGKVALYQMS